MISNIEYSHASCRSEFIIPLSKIWHSDRYGALAERGFEEKELKSFGPYITLDGDKTMEFALGIGYS